MSDIANHWLIKKSVPVQSDKQAFKKSISHFLSHSTDQSIKAWTVNIPFWSLQGEPQ